MRCARRSTRASVARSPPSTDPTLPPRRPRPTTTSSSIRFESSRFPSSSRTLTHRRSHRPNPSSFSRRAWGSSRCPCRAWTSRGRQTPSPPRRPCSTAVNPNSSSSGLNRRLRSRVRLHGTSRTRRG